MATFTVGRRVYLTSVVEADSEEEAATKAAGFKIDDVQTDIFRWPDDNAEHSKAAKAPVFDITSGRRVA
jgi:hypothetical protein